MTNWPPNLPFNNVIRVGTKRLTGLHLVKTDQYYTKKLQAHQKVIYAGTVNNDEVLLYQLCEQAHGMCSADHGMLPNSPRSRPVLGIHFSPNRGDDKSMSLRTSQRYFNTFTSVMTQYPNCLKIKAIQNLATLLKSRFHIIPN